MYPLDDQPRTQVPPGVRCHRCASVCDKNEMIKYGAAIVLCYMYSEYVR
jgi:hypothetical protein